MFLLPFNTTVMVCLFCHFTGCPTVGMNHRPLGHLHSRYSGLKVNFNWSMTCFNFMGIDILKLVNKELNYGLKIILVFRQKQPI